ncbi:telomerase protein component 1-like [Amphibalanus amphitrite]|uniref:telomerase protein component 1-like n=1 Tax=Amphibalanus amphitrite TaxID=1232801 RepID=UPI001C9166B9|nr:telomerase protein component 1-like [Amphibalanus amphitrite]
MADKRPPPPLPLENKLLKTLSASVAASAGRRAGSDGSRPAASDLRPPPLENRLLAQLSLRSSALTGGASSALPLRSSVLAKYEAEHRPPPPPPPHGLGVMMCQAEMARDSVACEEEDDDDMGMALFDDCESVSFSSRSVDPIMYKSRSRARPRLARMEPRRFPGAGNGASWAQPEPQYDFKGVQLGEYDDRPTWTTPGQAERPDQELLRTTKLDFLTAVCVSLVSQPDFKQREDPLRQRLLQQAGRLAELEPEFLLKVALYARQELMLRTTANFLLSLAAFVEPCRPYLRKYFCATIRLPTDWIEVAEIYQTFDDSKINFGSLPNALRKVMTDKFGEFDNYQLAKYNKGGGKKKRKKKTKGQRWNARLEKWRKEAEGSDMETDDEKDDDEDENGDKKEAENGDKKEAENGGGGGGEDGVVPDPDAETDEQLRRRSFTIKKLVRLLHVRRPVEPVMAIVGKKYPADPDAFRRSGLPGTFDSSRSGQRMRLPVPETWETQVAQRGNKAEVWQQLIDNKKLPYMAMLRNLRNLILAKIGAAHHDKVISTLTNENAVLNSKQMVFRYLSAYAALDELEVLITDSLAEQEAARASEQGETPAERGQARRRGAPKKPAPQRFSKEYWIARKKRVISAKQQKSKYDLEVVRRYRLALDRAVAIATIHNVAPISGRTLIFCDVSERMDHVCASAKGMGKPKTARTMALLLALMCQRSSEHCELAVFGQGAPYLLPRQRNVNLLKQAADEETAVDLQRRRGFERSAAADWGDAASEESCSEDMSADSSSDPECESNSPQQKSGKPKSVLMPGYTPAQLSEGVAAVESALDFCLHERQWVSTSRCFGHRETGRQPTVEDHSGRRVAPVGALWYGTGRARSWHALVS